MASTIAIPVTAKPGAEQRTARARWRLFYNVRVLVVACLVGLLPVVYSLSILVLSSMAIWEARESIVLIHFDSTFGEADMWRIFWVLGEAAACFLLLRQLVTPAAKDDAWQQVTPVEQPEFHQVVKLVAQKVGAPAPHRVAVDSSAVLIADYPSFLSAVLGRGLRLRVGMALPVGLDSAQFVGLLAHELGFYSRGAGVCASRFIRGVHRWFFMRVRHDPWLEWLDQRAKVSFSKVRRFGLRLLWCGLWLSLRPLRLLYGLCRVISAVTMREMVYKADECAASLVGSDVFSEALELRARIVHVWADAHSKIYRGAEHDRLPDNIPLLVGRSLMGAGDIPDDHLPAVTHWLDMAPPDVKRIRRVLAMRRPGIVDCQGPATSLFYNFHELARHLTYFHYQNDWGLRVIEHRLVAVEETVHQQRASNETMSILNRYFRGLAHPERAFCGIAEEQTAPRDLEMLKMELQDCRHWLTTYGERMATVLTEWTKTWELVRDLEMAFLLSSAGLTVPRGQFSVHENTPEAYHDEINRQRGIMDNMEGLLREFEGRLETRLAGALELLWRAEDGTLPPKLADVRETLPHWVLIYEALGLHLPVLRELLTHFHAFQALGTSVAGVVNSEEYGQTVRSQFPRLIGFVQDLTRSLAEWPYPFRANFGSETVNLAAFIAPQALEPGALDFEYFYRQANRRDAAQEAGRRLAAVIVPLMDRYLNLYHQSFAWVTKAADMAEWHFLDPFDPEFHAEAQQLHQAQRYVAPPPQRVETMVDPELMYSERSSLAMQY